jgi:hypothetical protein
MLPSASEIKRESMCVHARVRVRVGSTLKMEVACTSGTSATLPTFI